jgi:hypothetical protein
MKTDKLQRNSQTVTLRIALKLTVYSAIAWSIAASATTDGQDDR